MATKAEQDQELLEKMLDENGSALPEEKVAYVLKCLIAVCGFKESHVRDVWQDEVLAGEWRKVCDTLENAEARIGLGMKIPKVQWSRDIKGRS